MNFSRYFLLVPWFLCASSAYCAVPSVVEDGQDHQDLIERVKVIKSEGTIDWYKNEECRLIFFTVLEGLYQDGISDEIVDLVVGKLKKNDVKKNFVFQCKLCHATFEAFALYQRRPKFYGVDKKSFGNKKIPDSVMKNLKSSDPTSFGKGLSVIVQPWIKAKLLQLSDNESFLINKIKNFADLAKEGNMLKSSYIECQACDAIKTVGDILNKK